MQRKNVSPIFQVESSSVRSASLISPPEHGSKSYNMVHARKGLANVTNYIMVFVIVFSLLRSFYLFLSTKVEYMSQNLFSFVADGRWNTNHPGEKRNRKIYSQNVSCREKQKFKGAGSYNKVRFCTMSESFNKSSFGGMPCFYVLSFPGLYLWFLHMEAILDY